MEWSKIAAHQAGAVSRRQLLAAGYRRGEISGLVSGRRLAVTKWSGVYQAVGTPTTPAATEWAAVLDANAVLSYLSAASWWDLETTSDGRIHVTAPNRRRTTMPKGVRVHRVALTDAAVTERFGMPITTRTETVLDCIGWLPLAGASRLTDRAMQQKWIKAADIERRLDDQPGRWGNRRLAYLLRQSSSGAHAESERLMMRILKQAGISGWQVNFPVFVGGSRYVLDFAFPDRKVAIEIDGWAFHHDELRFRADRRRGNSLDLAGWTVLHFTWADLVEDPERVVAELLTLLAA